MRAMGYLEFNYLVKTQGHHDSGEITEEASLWTSLVSRFNTERAETIHLGTNELRWGDPAKLKPYLEKIMTSQGGSLISRDTHVQDSQTAGRIDILIKSYS
jgi:UDP-N-acetylglucosamine 2-epimerase (non-hydrolysing)